jgi:hypothetical protein
VSRSYSKWCIPFPWLVALDTVSENRRGSRQQTTMLFTQRRGNGVLGVRLSGSATKYTPSDSLSLCSETRAIVCLFGARRLSQHNPILSFPSPEKAPIRIYQGIPQVECFLALSCSRRTCGDEFPMSSAKEILGLFPRMSGRTRTSSPLLGRSFVTPPLLLFGSLAASQLL